MLVRNAALTGSLGLLAALGCVGTRSEARPSGPEGYPLVDLPAEGLINQNLEVIGTLGKISPDPDGCGTVKFGILRGDDTGSLGAGSIVGTLPAARADEVRKLRVGDQVRVRGYLSNFEAEGCSAGATDQERFLWVDSIQPAR